LPGLPLQARRRKLGDAGQQRLVLGNQLVDARRSPLICRSSPGTSGFSSSASESIFSGGMRA
jgi:hypothetical protein